MVDTYPCEFLGGPLDGAVYAVRDDQDEWNVPVANTMLGHALNVLAQTGDDRLILKIEKAVYRRDPMPVRPLGAGHETHVTVSRRFRYVS